MSGLDVAIIVIVSLAAAGVAAYLIYRKVKHKGGCCDCADCPHCGGCHKK